MDFVDKKTRSRIMSKIKSWNTKPELLLKKFLAGYSYQPKVFGRPDFINYKRKIVVFVDGCFWHQCPIHSRKPKQNQEYWIPKLKRNLVRAREVEIAYKNFGWKVVRIWEHEIKENLEKCIKKIERFYL
ncbi:very short patch repair endonuclease [Candidatus Pacearchaeota archaeon]|nr:very short patch repair endonuclease [Candidatus Pacearchaeota archaeon]